MITGFFKRNKNCAFPKGFAKLQRFITLHEGAILESEVTK